MLNANLMHAGNVYNMSTMSTDKLLYSSGMDNIKIVSSEMVQYLNTETGTVWYSMSIK